ncbi:hypothetical protein MFIFM68171_03414 [Madurella fahalii]|uniref:Ketosynthase family 3 (KS3) domain-containing protein n=1 Tax=Madurella fahalii TaxID=1157608 RepID=A0ABQ0G614_9PEZI
MVETRPRIVASAAVFSPQSSAPKSSLVQIRLRLLQNPLLKPLADAITNLPETWRILTFLTEDLPQQVNQNGSHTDAGSDVGIVPEMLNRVRSFSNWIKTGESSVLKRDMSGIVTLPLLFTIHVVQYLEYLQQTGLRHSEVLEGVQAGGIQGYCIGLLSAIVLASSRDEQELVQYAVSGLRLAPGIGAFGDRVGEDVGKSTLQIRLRKPGDGDEVIRKFPGAFLSAITDATTVSLTVPCDLVANLISYAEKEGFRPRMMHIRSNLHNPSNEVLARKCCAILEQMQPGFPAWDLLQVPVRSNRTAEPLTLKNQTRAATAIQEVVITVLASACNWAAVMQHLALDLQRTGQKPPIIVVFGIGDPVPLAPFQKHGLEVTKAHVDTLLRTANAPAGYSTLNCFPHDAIAIVGAVCRLPGASSLDELWDLVSQGQSRLEKIRIDRVNIKRSYRASQDPDGVAKREFFGNFIDHVDAFDHAFFGVSPREATYMDPQQRLLLETAFDALDSSRYMRNHQRERGDAVGCFLGASYTEYLENTSAYPPSAFTATSAIRAFLSGKISYHFGRTGPSEVIDTACSASLAAVNRACQAINSGECHIALAGGVNIITGVNNYFDLAKANFLSPTGQCKPFDESADGYCHADGVALVVLNLLRQAVSDGDHILGVIPAVATNRAVSVPPASPYQTASFKRRFTDGY